MHSGQPLAPDISVELPGHGDTPVAPDARFDMTTLAQAIGAHITRAAVTKPLVFGYSMGGYAALWLEHLSPGTVAWVSRAELSP